ncbi:MAG: thioredoxin-disulfide reductase [Nitrospirota bacterium]
MKKLVILGSGPAGLTAAIYAARANLSPIVIEGIQAGGQLTLTTMVENYPGFKDGVMGSDLMVTIKAQAERFGASFVRGSAASINLSSRPFKITVENDIYNADCLIIATGASARLLNLESEKRLMGRGVSTCATCDGYFFRNKEVFVVGGGDTALEDATFLTKFASKVTIIHRRDKLRASKIMQEKAFKNEKMEFIWDSIVEEIIGDEIVSGAKIKNLKTSSVTEQKCDGIFIAIGHTPNTQLFTGQIDMDEKGYIIVKDKTRTGVKGVFAAGDVQDHRYRQAITAAGSGCMAAIDAERFIEGDEC